MDLAAFIRLSSDKEVSRAFGELPYNELTLFASHTSTSPVLPQVLVTVTWLPRVALGCLHASLLPYRLAKNCKLFIKAGGGGVETSAPLQWRPVVIVSLIDSQLQCLRKKKREESQ